MANETSGPATDKEKYTGGAVGAGLVLIVLPCVALYYGTDRMGAMPAMGLPILAIFGIMILFGALALISALFANLGLSDSNQALALPEGSIRAAIALALIVLFAIISIMLYQSVSKPYVIPGLGEQEKSEFVKSQAERVIAVVLEPCATSPTGAGAAGASASKAGDTSVKCAPENLRFSVHVRQPPAQESTDLAKQLLILIGTLMTSVTSFYFASRATEPKRKDESLAPTVDGSRTSPQASQSATLAAGSTRDESHIDGCDIPIVDATPDEDLPASKGGVLT
jgi:hypothetical protein